jgi:glutamate--cysteine ligase
MIQDVLHQNFCQKSKEICDWYSELTAQVSLPIYSSYDIRDSGFKVANVDANVYPAGFNNICSQDFDSAIDLMDRFLTTRYGSGIKKIALVTEEHTANLYYWDNVAAIKQLLEQTGRQVLVAFPQRIDSFTIKSASGKDVHVVGGFEDSPEWKEFKPDLIISNNDFSEPHEEWGNQILAPLAPPRQLGWYQRKKSNYFRHYNKLAMEFAALVKMDSFQFTVETELFEGFDPDDKESLENLANRTDAMISRIQAAYDERKIQSKPVIFIKNNAGTYGLGVVRVESGADVKNWNVKARKKMKSAKGGRDISEVIIQEGIPSRVLSDGATAEPAIYMIGCELAGGFLRTHSEKSSTESLNSPGAVYKRLCVSDLVVSLEQNPLENVYGWSARLGLVAIGLEAKEMKIDFLGYGPGLCR